jgi:hypothetical protein
MEQLERKKPDSMDDLLAKLSGKSQAKILNSFSKEERKKTSRSGKI